MNFQPGMRLDKWLWFARLSPSRTTASALCKSRRLRVDGRVVDRAGAIVRPGSVLVFPKGNEIIAVRVEALAERRGPYAEAKLLYTHLMRTQIGQEKSLVSH